MAYGKKLWAYACFSMLNSLVSLNPYLSTMTNKRHPPLRTLSCQQCGQKGNLQRIIYGMPDPKTFDFEKYAVGGCLVEDNQPDIRCRDCGWRGIKALPLT